MNAQSLPFPDGHRDGPQRAARGRASTGLPGMSGRMHEIRRRVLLVERIEQLSETMRRFTLGGPELESDFPFVARAASDHVKLVFPDEQGVLTMPEQQPGARLRDPVGGRIPIIREYTIRGYDRASGGIIIDFVLHDHGVAGRWAGRARIGDPVGVLGPRGSRIFPSEPSCYLIAVDETALPAAERLVEELPSSIDVRLFVIAPASGRRPLGRSARGQIEWLDDPGLLPDAVAASAVSRPVPADAVLWAAGESDAIRRLRLRILSDGILPADRMDLHGYWRLGVSGALGKEDSSIAEAPAG